MTISTELALLHLEAEQSAAVRTETLQGREHRVIPSVLVRSQVLHNNLGRALLPADDITAEWAEMWNGVPVLIGAHPQSRGQAISGRQPCLWDSRGAGWIFNAKAEQENGAVRRLKAEVWLDVTRAAVVPGLQAVLDKVDAGGVVELSTGFPVEAIAQHGQFEGRQYDMVMHPAGVDHLVVSADMTGACSVRHGCGLGANEEGVEGDKIPASQVVDADVEKPGSTFRALISRATQQLFQGTEALRAMRILWGRKPEATEEAHPLSDNEARIAEREILARHSIAATDQEHMNMVRDALQHKVGSGEKTVVVSDCYSTTSPKMVVFWYSTPFGPQPSGAEYYRSEYTENGTGQYTFSEPVLVRRMTAYEEVATNAAPAANAEETEESMTNEDKQELATMLATAIKPFGDRLAAIEEGAAKVAETATNAANAAVTAVAGPLKTLVDGITASVNALAATVNAERDEMRVELVKELAANTKVPFTAAELESKPLDELRKLAEMANVTVAANYGARGGPRSTNAAAEEALYAEPVPYWQKPAAEASNTTDKEVK